MYNMTQIMSENSIYLHTYKLKRLKGNVYSQLSSLGGKIEADLVFFCIYFSLLSFFFKLPYLSFIHNQIKIILKAVVAYNTGPFLDLKKYMRLYFWSDHFMSAPVLFKNPQLQSRTI